ncbi:MAG: hypothetical protein QM811_09670 [Pirellulales bacterium]
MSTCLPSGVTPSLWALVETAAAAGKLTGNSVPNLACWLSNARYADSVPLITELITQERWKELDAAFWTVIPFGTAGRRGVMYPVGPNAINDRTMGESAPRLGRVSGRTISR